MGLAHAKTVLTFDHTFRYSIRISSTESKSERRNILGAFFTIGIGWKSSRSPYIGAAVDDVCFLAFSS